MFSDVSTSWRTKVWTKKWKYVVLDFNKLFGLTFSDYTIDPLPNGFRPGGYNTTGGFSEDNVLEIPGSAGQFLAIW
jgi:hypothetical protein